LDSSKLRVVLSSWYLRVGVCWDEEIVNLQSAGGENVPGIQDATTTNSIRFDAVAFVLANLLPLSLLRFQR